MKHSYTLGLIEHATFRERQPSGTRHYRYYVCATTQTKGWQECPSKSVPAGELERFVVEQIKEVCRDPQLIVEVAQILGEQSAEKLKSERCLNDNSATTTKSSRPPQR